MNSDGTQDTRTDDTVKAEEDALTRRQMLTVAVKTAAGAGAGLLLLLPMVREAAHANATHPAATHPAATHSAAPAAHPDTSTWTSLGKTESFVLNQPKRTEMPNGDVLYVTRLTADAIDGGIDVASSASSTSSHAAPRLYGASTTVGGVSSKRSSSDAAK